MEGWGTEGNGVREDYTIYNNMLHLFAIKGKKSITQTRTDLPAVHILLVKHFLCLIELSVCTSVKRKKKKTMIVRFV